MYKLLQYTILLIIVASCSSTGPELPTWLEGEWKTNNKSGFAGENWWVENDTLLSGQGLVHVAGQLRVMTKRDHKAGLIPGTRRCNRAQTTSG